MDPGAMMLMGDNLLHGGGINVGVKRKLDNVDPNSHALMNSEEAMEPPPKKRQGRRKIKIEYIEDKTRRQITFSKRKAGIMKKAYELTTLTGTQGLLLIASETGHVYTFATSKLQPFVTHQEGKALIQSCLNETEDAGSALGPVGGGEEEDFARQRGRTRVSAQQPPEEIPVRSTPSQIESTLVLLVGKRIPVLSPFNLGSMVELRETAASFSDLSEHASSVGTEVTCLAGGYPTSLFGADANPNYPINVSEVVAGWKVATIDYTSEHQPAFSVDTLRAFLQDAPHHLPPNLWPQLASKPYVNNREEPHWNSAPLSLFVISTYHNACVNLVFGVRKGDGGGEVGGGGGAGGGHQVVGISCMPPDSHVCTLDIGLDVHEGRLEMMREVDGVPFYHLLPELRHG